MRFQRRFGTTGRSMRCAEVEIVVPANKTLIRAGLEALYFSGSHLALRPFVGGVGAILTLHHVRPARAGAFQPNRLLEVTPEFLDAVIRRIRRSGADIVSLDEMH